MEAPLSVVARFAGYPSPKAMVADPSLTREDKLSGLRTWRNLILRCSAGDEERECSQLVREIDKSLAQLAPKRPS
jgi:hypothetical protein